VKNMKILVADDDSMIREVLTDVLEDLGHEVAGVGTAGEAIQAVGQQRFDLVLLDLRFPDSDDLQPLAEIRKISPQADVIMVTAETDNLGLVAEAMKLGASDYVPKPIRDDDIRIRVTRVMQMRALRRAHSRAVAQLARGGEVTDIVGQSDPLKLVIQQIQEMAGYEFPVLVTGETGTGKELVARALHFCSLRRDRPFVSINCAALAQGLVESELFGHEKGSFTGASNSRKGAFEEAENGTLFLDEIGDMSPQAQASLLRVLEGGEYRSVGGRMKKTEARIVLASNQDLNQLIEEGEFRKDLFYRINRLKIELPPLRQRRGDVPLLARHFLEQIDAKIGKGLRDISEEALNVLQIYPWPGNVRELRNEMERAYIHCGESMLRVMDFSSEILVGQGSGTDGDPVSAEALSEAQRLLDALRVSDGNRSQAARRLGVHRNTIRRWMKKFGMLDADEPSSGEQGD
jgi:DNA-binding NtrC family response regulator